jgi:RNA exonuclease 4
MANHRSKNRCKRCLTGINIALDCEMVRVTNGKEKIFQVLASVTLVNKNLGVIYYAYVKLPYWAVKVDYRTEISGIKQEDLEPSNGAVHFLTAQKNVRQIIADNILIGHALGNDLKALKLIHNNVRDTALMPCLMKRINGHLQSESLKNLALEVGLSIQSGSHSSAEDAKASMIVFLRREEIARKRFLRYYFQAWSIKVNN